MLKVQKPDYVYLWYDSLPTGQWWEYLLKYVSHNKVDFQFKKTEVPTHIYGKEILKMEHKSDVLRLRCLEQYGGIYMDMDVMFVQPMTPLRCYNFTLGEQGLKLNNGIILSTPGNEVFYHWWKIYKSNFNPKGWSEASVIGATVIARNHPELVHVEKTSMNRPGASERRQIYYGHFNWTEKYCVHLWGVDRIGEISPETIKYMNSSAGDMFRLTWYGNTTLFHQTE